MACRKKRTTKPRKPAKARAHSTKKGAHGGSHKRSAKKPHKARKARKSC